MAKKDQPEFELSVVESLEAYAPREERAGVTEADLITTPAEAFEALKATKGAADILKQFPQLDRPEAWLSTAYFSACRKSGTARYLDLWDADHFDGVTDMQRCINDCRVWFSDSGYQAWGSDQTRTGRINCYFNAPTTGLYTINAKLQSYPSNAQASVECIIDDSSFGPLGVSGTINQPHMAHLGKGGHHFRIRQRFGSFFFLSLTIWTPPVLAPT